MNMQKTLKFGRVRAAIAGFLVFIGILTGVGTTVLQNNTVYAIGENETTTTETNTNETNTTENKTEENKTTTGTKANDAKKASEGGAGDLTGVSDANCKRSMGALGWVICPAIAKISEAVD